jgi:hypothetical protein
MLTFDWTLCSECEAALISVLLMSFDLLRVQLGSELINSILQSTFAAFNMYVTHRKSVEAMKLIRSSDNVRTVLREAKPIAQSAVARYVLIFYLTETSMDRLS